MISLQLKKTQTHDWKGVLPTPKQVEETISLHQFMRSLYVEEFWDAIGRLGVMPPLHIVNQLIARGPQNDRADEWTPVEVSEAEFLFLQQQLCDGSGGYCIEDRSLWGCADYTSWREALVAKIRANPSYKGLSRAVQHALLGIPLGQGRWLERREVTNYRRARDVDPILHPLRKFLMSLSHCLPDCCGIEAFAFDPEMIEASCEKFGRIEPMHALDKVLIDLENLELKHTEVCSQFMNCTMHRDDLLALLRHIETTLCEVG